MRRSRILIWPLLASVLAPGAASAAPADPYVVYTANSFADGAVILRTDPAAGSLVEISRNGPQGTLFQRPFDVAVEADGDLVVADLGGPCTPALPRCAEDGRLIRVDTLTGRQTLIAGGAPLLDPAGVAVAPNGDIYVADNFGADDNGAVIRVDPATGAKSVISAGGSLDLPFGIAVDRDGSLVVTNRMSPGGGCSGTPGRVVRVQLNGDQQVLSEGGLFKYPLGVALDGAGRIAFANECGPNGLLRVLGATSQSPITSNGDADVLVTPERPALDPAGDFLVSDFSVGDGDGGIVRVNAQSGAQSLLRQGELFNHPLGIAAVVNRAPTAALQLLPSTVAAGKPVLLDGSASSDPDGLRLVHDWDLDGDGVFETAGGTAATVSRAWTRQGPFTVRLRVSDPHGGQAIAEGVVNVDGSAPVITALRADSRVLGVRPRRRPRHAAGAGAAQRRPAAQRRRAAKPPPATALRFTLSEPAHVHVVLERVRAGRRARAGAPCRLRAKRGRRCLRRSPVRTIATDGLAGANSVRIRARGLRPGSYRLNVAAADAVGNGAITRTLPLRVVRVGGSAQK